jgi:hypothetical protein
LGREGHLPPLPSVAKESYDSNASSYCSSSSMLSSVRNVTQTHRMKMNYQRLRYNAPTEDATLPGVKLQACVCECMFECVFE